MVIPLSGCKEIPTTPPLVLTYRSAADLADTMLAPPMESLRTTEAEIANLLSVLRNPEMLSNRRDLDTALNGSTKDLPLDLGFGLTRATYRTATPHFQSTLSILAYRDSIVRYRIEYPRRSFGTLVRIISSSPRLRAMVCLAVDSSAPFQIQYANPELDARSHSQIERALGRASLDSIADRESRKIVEELSDPLKVLHFGAMCYEDGSPPFGRVAVDSLKAKRDWTALRQLARSRNSVSRTYAIDAILGAARDGLRSLDGQDSSLVRAALATDMQVVVCRGCLVSIGHPEDALDADLLRLVGR